MQMTSFLDDPVLVYILSRKDHVHKVLRPPLRTKKATCIIRWRERYYVISFSVVGG